MKKQDDESKSLGLNLEVYLSLRGWSLAEALEHAGFGLGTPEHRTIRDELKRCIRRRQKRWSGTRHFAWAWGVPEHALLFDDLRNFKTLADLEAHYQPDEAQREEAG